MSTLHPHDQQIAQSRALIEGASETDLRRAELAYRTFHPDAEHDLMHWAELRPTYVARWIEVGRALAGDPRGRV